MDVNMDTSEVQQKEIPTISSTGIVFEEKISNEGEEGDGFATIPLDMEKGEKKKKVPRRIVHFSDGILEEYSTDEEEEVMPQKPPVDPRTLPWFPWFWFYMCAVMVGALGVADYFGEKLAWFFGITSPKYQYAIDEFHRMKEEDEEEKKRGDREQEAERQRLAEDMAQAEGGGIHPTNPVSTFVQPVAEITAEGVSQQTSSSPNTPKIQNTSNMYVEGQLQNAISYGETTRI